MENEELEYNIPELSEDEKQSFEVSTICDLLTTSLGTYANLSNLLGSSDENISERIKLILSSILEDYSIIIGKLQQSLKEVNEEENTEGIIEGEEQIQEISSNVEEE